MSNPSDDAYPTQQVLELAVAAQRINKDYIKITEAVYADDAKVVAYKFANKQLMQSMVNPALLSSLGDFKPPLLCTTLEDKQVAEDIKKFYRKFMFSAVEGENDFQTTVNQLLTSDTVKLSFFGYIACLPSLYERDSTKKRIKKSLAECEDSVLGAVDDTLIDQDAEIVSVRRSKNFDAWNVLAIVDNKICSWFSKREMTIGPAVIVKAKIKGFGENWDTKKPETRLNYVKAAQ